MTKATVRRLFKLFTESNNSVALADLVSKRPWVLDESKPVKKEVKQDAKKSKR